MTRDEAWQVFLDAWRNDLTARGIGRFYNRIMTRQQFLDGLESWLVCELRLFGPTVLDLEGLRRIGTILESLKEDRLKELTLRGQQIIILDDGWYQI